MGGEGGQLKDLSDIPVIVPSKTTARVQEAHMLIYHWWCERVDEVSE